MLARKSQKVHTASYFTKPCLWISLFVNVLFFTGTLDYLYVTERSVVDIVHAAAAASSSSSSSSSAHTTAFDESDFWTAEVRASRLRAAALPRLLRVRSSRLSFFDEAATAPDGATRKLDLETASKSKLKISVESEEREEGAARHRDINVLLYDALWLDAHNHTNEAKYLTLAIFSLYVSRDIYLSAMGGKLRYNEAAVRASQQHGTLLTMSLSHSIALRISVYCIRRYNSLFFLVSIAYFHVLSCRFHFYFLKIYCAGSGCDSANLKLTAILRREMRL
jgi:hypothetical protein